MKYIDAEQIRAEIKRLANVNKQCGSRPFTEGIAAGYADVLRFLDTLPEQPVEGLEEEIERVCAEIEEKNPQHRGLKPSGIAKIARHFAEWQKAKMLKGVMEGEIMTNGLYPYEPRIVVPFPNCQYDFGDKVKIIIVKEDEK